MPDLSDLTARLALLESRLDLAERALSVEMLDLIRRMPVEDGPMEDRITA